MMLPNWTEPNRNGNAREGERGGGGGLARVDISHMWDPLPWTGVQLLVGDVRLGLDLDLGLASAHA